MLGQILLVANNQAKYLPSIRAAVLIPECVATLMTILQHAVAACDPDMYIFPVCKTRSEPCRRGCFCQFPDVFPDGVANDDVVVAAFCFRTLRMCSSL
jgi:hypothetical protein